MKKMSSEEENNKIYRTEKNIPRDSQIILCCLLASAAVLLCMQIFENTHPFAGAERAKGFGHKSPDCHVSCRDNVPPRIKVKIYIFHSADLECKIVFRYIL